MKKETDGAKLSYRLGEEFSGIRMDAVLRRLQPDWSRSQVAECFRQQRVLISGRPATAALKAKPSQTFELLPEVTRPTLPPPTLPLLYQDEALLAVDKPSGIPTHPLRTGEGGTALDGMIALCPEVALLFFGERSPDSGLPATKAERMQSKRRQLEGGLLHRLDTATSGVLLAAKSLEAWHALRAALDERDAYKEYLAIVSGNLNTVCTARFPIGHAAGDPGRSVAIFPSGWPVPEGAARVRGSERGWPRMAVSHVFPLAETRDASLVRVRVHKAVTHQVRVHLAALGHPIAGDERYLPQGWPSLAPRLALHATRVVFAHPASGQVCTIHSALAKDLADVWRDLGGVVPD